MGTDKHSLASKNRWSKIPLEERKKKMSIISKGGWDRLNIKARRRRAMKGVRTRKALIN